VTPLPPTRVIFAGGGTGGHLYPLLAVIKALRKQDPHVDVLLVGARKGLDAELLPRLDVPFRLIPAEPLTRRPLSEFVRGVFGCTLGTFASVRILREFRPDVVFSTGAHVGGCICIAARLLRIPYVLHESDAVPGRANRSLAAGAARLTLAFDAAEAQLPADKTVHTGQPIRSEIGRAERGPSRAQLGLEQDRTTILVMGGSRGARRINEALLGALPLLAREPDIQILHITGTLDADSISVRLAAGDEQAPPWYHMRPYVQNMAQALAAADLVVSRAGSSTLAELAVCGLPSILVPYPFAAHQHQTANARVFEKAGASVVLEDSKCTAEALAGTLSELLHDVSRLDRMARAARDLARPDAAESVAKVLLEVASR